MAGRQFRQGDVLLEAIPVLPEGSVPQERENGQVVLAYGEVTGHAHAISERGCDLFAGASGETYLRVSGSECTLRHEEHAPIQLPAGCYRILRQREYEPNPAGSTRYVAD